jgi:hypothetical protein
MGAVDRIGWTPVHLGVLAKTGSHTARCPSGIKPSGI